MMFCVNCGARLNAGARFCFSCGARVAEWIVADAEGGADGLDEPVEPEGQAAPAVPEGPAESDGAGASGQSAGADDSNVFGAYGESAGPDGPGPAAKRDFASASWFVSGDAAVGMDETPDLEEAPAPMAAAQGSGELAADWAAGQAGEPVGTPEPAADAAADTLPASPWAEEPEPYPAAKVRFVAAPAPAAPGAGPFIKLCPSCGTELEPDDMFCPECGARVWAAEGSSAAARSSQNRSAFDTLTAEQAAKPLVDTSAPRHRARRGAVGLVAGIMLLGLLVGVGVAVAMHALSDGSEETEITSIVLAEESSAEDEDDEESADIVNDSVTIVVGDEEDETEEDEEDEEDEDSDSDEQAIYEELAEAYAEALSYDTQVASSSSTFNTHYGNANTAESTRRSYASAAEALLAEIQQAGAAVEALEVPSDSVNYEAWQNIVELYECLEQRESILCEGWELALSYDDPSSSECSSAVTALMASASDGSHNKYWSRFRELCYTSDGSSDKSGWTQDATGSKIGLVDPSE